jgi:hypothetical protein
LRTVTSSNDAVTVLECNKNDKLLANGKVLHGPAFEALRATASSIALGLERLE